MQALSFTPNIQRGSAERTEKIKAADSTYYPKVQMERVNHVWFHLLIVLSLTIMAQSEDCIYSIFTRTEAMEGAETDSNIGLTIFDAAGGEVAIDNLVEWGGLMGADYNYFEQGNLDLFSGRGACLSGPVCALNLTTDGSGSYPGWYSNYVEINSLRVHNAPTQKLFTVDDWLSPDQLHIYYNDCASFGDAKKPDHAGLKKSTKKPDHAGLKKSLSVI